VQFSYGAAYLSRVQRISVGCSSSLHCIWAYLFHSILCGLVCLFNRRRCCLCTCIFTVVCSVPGGVCPKAACVLPFDFSVLQQVLMPLDMSVPHWTLKSKVLRKPCAASGRVCPTAACDAAGRVLLYRRLDFLWTCLFCSRLCCL
jgi:hypothetical protein